jgi:hypothetical protein
VIASVVRVARAESHEDVRMGIREIEIWRTAQHVLRRYGEQADRAAVQRVQEHEAEGDEAAAATWRRICQAVVVLGAVEAQHYWAI